MKYYTFLMFIYGSLIKTGLHTITLVRNNVKTSPKSLSRYRCVSVLSEWSSGPDRRTACFHLDKQ